MTTKPLTILTGINRPSQPSSGSMTLVGDLYRAMPNTHSTFLGRTPVHQMWKTAFDRLIPLSTTKQPQGPGFDTYVDELTHEVGKLIEQIRPDAIHAQNVGFALSLALSRTAGTIPIISIAHGPEVTAAERNKTEHEAVLEVAGASAAIVTPTSVLADRIDRLTGHRFTNRIVIIPWGIRLADAHVRDQPYAGSGPLSLVHAGRLDDNKSTITAVESLALTDQPHHLTVIGNGPLREHLEQRTIELGLRDRVHFDPFLPRAELWHRHAELRRLRLHDQGSGGFRARPHRGSSPRTSGCLLRSSRCEGNPRERWRSVHSRRPVLAGRGPRRDGRKLPSAEGRNQGGPT